MKHRIISFFCAMAAALTVSAQVPSLINYQGRLTDATGAPVTGSKNFAISIYDAATGGNLLYEESIGAVTLDNNGVYSFQFGSAGTSNTQVTETIGTTDGTTLVYSKALTSTPVINNSITVTDGTNSWSQSAGNPGVEAVATATVTAGFVTGASITNGGSGYTSVPTVTITGNGTGATATATISSGVVTSINIISAGSGYTGGATITIAPPVIPFRVDYSGGTITATYSSAPAAGQIIDTTYRYSDSGIAGALSAETGHWMAVSVDGVLQVPRQRVLAVPFAMMSGGLTAGAVTSSMIANGAVGSAQLGNDAVAANLRASGQSAVPTGGVVLSVGPNPSLVAEGYVRIGQTTLSALWKQIAVSKPPVARATHTAVWTGSEMIIWGGNDTSSGDSLINTGGIYNPSTQSWRTVSTQNAPGPRSYHQAIWTGSEMIVWGGYKGNSTQYNDGGRYNPATDTWTSVSAIGAPSGRDRYTAIWTGTEMIVWGSASDAGAYNPRTDTWRSLSTINAPSRRSDHRAVWTGSRMLIWGGVNGTTWFNTGGSYDPITDTWTVISTSGAPSGRAFHTAVWTGTEMIVWGGSNVETAGTNSNYFNDGGRYNPTSNTWTAIAADALMPGRAFHTAIWTGSDMIVWGGRIVNTPYAGGGSYNPINNSWTNVATINAPPARSAHTAVWSGGEMIVFGGFNSVYNCLNDVSTYMPPNLMYLYQKP